MNTPSQTSQTVGDFYDVIGRIGSISTLKVLSQTVPDVGDFYDECEHKICPSGTVADDRDFYDECEREICVSGASGMLDFVFACYKSLIFIELSMYNFEYCSQKTKYEKRESELCLKLYSVKGVIDLEIVDLTLIIMP